MGPCCLHIHIQDHFTLPYLGMGLFFYTSILTGIGMGPCFFYISILTGTGMGPSFFYTPILTGLGMGPCFFLHIHTDRNRNGSCFFLHIHTYRNRNGTMFFYTPILTDLIFVLKHGVLLLPSLSLPLSCCQEVKDPLQLNLQSLGQS